MKQLAKTAPVDILFEAFPFASIISKLFEGKLTAFRLEAQD
jgi:hypothetical protein